MPGYFSHYTLRLLGLFFVIKQHLFCQIHRTLFALLKGAAHIFSDNSGTEQLYRSKEENQEENNTGNPEPENENTDSDGTEKSASKSESSRHVYREAIMTDGILVENIIQEINRLAETGTSDLGAVIFSCENA